VARLIHVPAALVSPRVRRAAPPSSESSVRLSRPSSHGVLEPWFELTPFAAAIDSRVTPGVGVGVLAELRTFGGVTAPDLGSNDAGQREVVLGGNTIPVHSPTPTGEAELRRQCSVQLRIHASGVSAGRQCLVIFALRGRNSQEQATVQVLAGNHLLETTTIVADDRLPLLVELHEAGDLDLELWLRLCGDPPDARLGVHGVAGFLL
jgi:hypothetical protein